MSNFIKKNFHHQLFIIEKEDGLKIDINAGSKLCEVSFRQNLQSIQ